MNGRRRLVQDRVRTAFAAVGVEVVPTLTDELLARIETGGYDAVIDGLNAGLFPDLLPVHGCTPRDPSRWFNHSHWCDPGFDALVERAENTADPAEAAKLWTEAQVRAYAAQPNLFLWWIDEATVIHRRFRDAEPNLTWVFGDVSQWWGE